MNTKQRFNALGNDGTQVYMYINVLSALLKKKKDEK